MQNIIDSLTEIPPIVLFYSGVLSVVLFGAVKLAAMVQAVAA